MVIKGKARGGIKQAFNYILGQGENDEVKLLHIGGVIHTDDPYEAMKEFALSEKLTGSKEAFYHGQLSPAYEESMSLSDADLVDMVYRTAKHLGYEQPRVIVTSHIKEGHKHVHYLLDRYDYKNKKLVPDSFNYYKHDSARKEIEDAYSLVKTPRRNPVRQVLKSDAKEAWDATTTGQQFVDALKAKGHTVAISKYDRPFRLIDQSGKSFNLVRKIEGIRQDDVRQRLKDVDLPLDKTVIKDIRKNEVEQKKFQGLTEEAQSEARIVTDKAIDLEERKRKFMEQFMAKGKSKGMDYER